MLITTLTSVTPLGSIIVPYSHLVSHQTLYLLEEDQEGDVGSQGGRQGALAGDQVEAPGGPYGTLLPPGGVLCYYTRGAVVRHHFPVAGEH